MISQSFPSSVLLNIFFEVALMINVLEPENVAFHCISKLLKIKS